jgi:hypothetical protein
MAKMGTILFLNKCSADRKWTPLERTGDWNAQSVQFTVATGKVVGVGISVLLMASIRFGLVMNRGPRHGIVLSARQGDANFERQAVTKGILETLEQIDALLRVGKIGRAVNAIMRHTRILVIGLLNVTGNDVFNDNGRCGGIVETRYFVVAANHHFARGHFTHEARPTGRFPTQGTDGITLRIARRVHDVTTRSVELHKLQG